MSSVVTFDANDDKSGGVYVNTVPVTLRSGVPALFFVMDNLRSPVLIHLPLSYLRN